MAKVTWSRVVMNRELELLVQDIAIRLGKVNMLEISGSRWKIEGEGAEYTQVHYPEFDLCKDKLEKKFNLIIAEMVFEHLPYPYRAGKNIYDMLEIPGFLVISVPFSYPIHNHPIDCTRWTPLGLRYLLTQCGFDFKKIYTNSWGNKDCANAHKDIPIDYDEKVHSLANDPLNPVSVWAVAQK